VRARRVAKGLPYADIRRKPAVLGWSRPHLIVAAARRGPATFEHCAIAMMKTTPLSHQASTVPVAGRTSLNYGVEREHLSTFSEMRHDVVNGGG